jgi:hypothetical protein
MGTEEGDLMGLGRANNLSAYLLKISREIGSFELCKFYQQHGYNHGAGFEMCVQLIKETKYTVEHTPIAEVILLFQA